MAEPLETNGFYEFGPYCLDRRSRVLLKDGAVVPLTPKALDTLVALVERAGQPLSKDELLRSVWPDTFVEESNLAQNISVLRKALGRSFIETLAKRGYRFTPDVRRAPRQPVAALAPAGSNTLPRERPKRRFVAAAVFGFAALFVGTASWRYYQHAVSVAPVRSLAVLPLKNLSGDPRQDYIADGITELLTAEISKKLPLRVLSRTSAMRYRNVDKPLALIARELRVDAVVEGSVVAEGGRLRVTAQLIQAATDRHLWAETYDREVSDLPLLQEEIARAVAREIKIPGAPTPLRRTAPTTPDAFDAYLRARYYLDERNEQGMAKAVSWYQRAIEGDPAYAPAYAGLADCYNQLGTVMIGGRSPAESRKLAMAAARRALEIDPDLAEAHAALAYSNLYDWNWEAAREGFGRAIRLNPNYAPAHLWLAHYLAARAQFDPALQEVRLAADLDPLSPIIQTQVGWILEFAHRYPEAIRQFREVLADNPSQQWALWRLGSALLYTRQYDAAIEVLRKLAEASSRSASSLGTLGHAYGLAGRRGEAVALLAELQARSRRQYVPPYVFVHIYVGLGERDEAFQWLERSYQERSNSLLWLGVDSGLEPLRGDPRFDNLLRRVGLK
jgi:TolB-like protein/DNA-binding winged helix-turn-helix (wHTH) protein/Tfp pilus assembly protein PilF